MDEADYRQLADVDTPSGHFDTRDVMSSSAVENGVSALNISDVSAITVNDKTLVNQSVHNLSALPTYRCVTCGMVCKTGAALNKHQVRPVFVWVVCVCCV